MALLNRLIMRRSDVDGNDEASAKLPGSAAGGRHSSFASAFGMHRPCASSAEVTADRVHTNTLADSSNPLVRLHSDVSIVTNPQVGSGAAVPLEAAARESHMSINAPPTITTRNATFLLGSASVAVHPNTQSTFSAQPSFVAAAALHDAAAVVDAPHRVAPLDAKRRLFGLIAADDGFASSQYANHAGADGSGDADPDAYSVGRRAAEAIALDPAALDSLLGDVAALGAILAPPRPVEDSDAALLAAFAARTAAEGSEEHDAHAAAAAARRTLRPRDEDFRDFDAPRGWHATRRAMAKVSMFRDNPDAAARLRERIHFYGVVGRDTRENARRQHRFEALRRAQQVELDMAAYNNGAQSGDGASLSRKSLPHDRSSSTTGPQQQQGQHGQSSCLDFSSSERAAAASETRCGSAEVASKPKHSVLSAWECAPEVGVTGATRVAGRGVGGDATAGANDVLGDGIAAMKRNSSSAGTAMATFGAMVRRQCGQPSAARAPTPTQSTRAASSTGVSGGRARPASASLFRVMPSAPADLTPDAPVPKPNLRPLSALTWRAELQRRKREGIPVCTTLASPAAVEATSTGSPSCPTLSMVAGVESDALAGTASVTLTNSQRAAAASAALGFVDRAARQRGGTDPESDSDDDDVPTAEHIWADAQLWYRHTVTERAPLVEVVPRGDADYWRMRARARDERTAAVVAARDSQYQRRQDALAARVATPTRNIASRPSSAAVRR
jgi:hypothetical protein